MDQKTVLAIVLSLLLVVAYQSVMEVYFPPPEMAIDSTIQTENQSVSSQGNSQEKIAVPDQMAPVPVAASPTVLPEAMPGQQDDANEPFVPFKTGLVDGKISLKGASFSDLRFLKHLTHLPPDNQPIRYFNRHGR
ncbi:MAG TPA: hypothetical protein HPQ00_12050, partial [Magnetococcales bacterium]|nr:hypothetical protein [Magnetococcales bacterium]